MIAKALKGRTFLFLGNRERHMRDAKLEDLDLYFRDIAATPLLTREEEILSSNASSKL